MFRMSFGQKVVENVEEHFSAYAYAYADISLCTQPSFMHMCT